jgi:hypothetical protein
VVPTSIAEDYGDPELIALLIKEGLWEESPEGYKLLRGPSTDWPMPLWRYGEKPDDGHLVSVDRDSLR